MMKKILQKYKNYILYEKAKINKSDKKFSTKDCIYFYNYKILNILDDGKNFIDWSIRKENIENKKKLFYASPRDIVWVDIGTNIGNEISGHGKDFCRPALILKRYGNLFSIAPITGGGITYDEQLQLWVIKDYYHKISSIQLTKDSFLILPQIRSIDVRRIKGKMKDINGVYVQISQEEFDIIRQKISKYILE